MQHVCKDHRPCRHVFQDPKSPGSLSGHRAHAGLGTFPMLLQCHYKHHCLGEPGICRSCIVGWQQRMYQVPVSCEWDPLPTRRPDAESLWVLHCLRWQLTVHALGTRMGNKPPYFWTNQPCLDTYKTYSIVINFACIKIFKVNMNSLKTEVSRYSQE